MTPLQSPLLLVILTSRCLRVPVLKPQNLVNLTIFIFQVISYNQCFKFHLFTGEAHIYFSNLHLEPKVHSEISNFWCLHLNVSNLIYPFFIFLPKPASPIFFLFSVDNNLLSCSARVPQNHFLLFLKGGVFVCFPCTSIWLEEPVTFKLIIVLAQVAITKYLDGCLK